MFSRARKYTIISIVISSLLSNTALPSNSFTDAETGLPTNPFTDMQAGIPADYALNSCVEYLFLQKVVFGYPDKTFRPNQIATPYEILMMRRKAFPIEPQSSMSNFASKDLPSRGSVAKDLCKSLGFVVTQFNHEFSIPRDEKLAMGTFIRILTAENKPTQIPFSNSRRPVKDFVKTLQASPKDAQSYYDRGVIRYYLTDFAGARKDLTKAIQMNSNLASAYYMRGCSSFNMWKRGEGKNPTVWGNEVVRKDFTKAIKLNSSLAEPYYYRVLISEFTGGQEATVDSDLAQAKSLGLNVNKIYGYRLMSLIEKTLYRKGYKSESFFDI